MLRIGDIHITSGQKDNILAELRRVVSDTDEKSVCFLGDYVYHFSYDRKALLGFVDFLMELQKEGREVYVLAGNHDWLQGHFVYHEAQSAVEGLGGGSIHFMTEPSWKYIENQWILFFPWNPALRAEGSQGTEEYREMTNTAHKGEQLSGHANLLMEKMLAERPTKETVLVAHHYYVANTQFPGQKGRFGYKSVALDPRWCDEKDVLMISGHIHKPFVWKNYLCLGSVWATHPQEHNQTKTVLKMNNGVGELVSCAVNFYASIESSEDVITSEVIEQIQENSREQMVKLMQGGEWTVTGDNGVRLLPAKNVSLQIQVDQKVYQDMSSWVNEDLQQSLNDIQLQTVNRKSYEDLVSDLEISHEELQQSYVQRKMILESYVSNKYPDEKNAYLDILQEAGVI